MISERSALMQTKLFFSAASTRSLSSPSPHPPRQLRRHHDRLACASSSQSLSSPPTTQLATSPEPSSSDTNQLSSSTLLPLHSLHPPRLPNLLHLPRPHHLTLNLTLLVRIDHRQYCHHAFHIIHKHLPLFLPLRLLHPSRSDHIEIRETQFFVRVHTGRLLLLGLLDRGAGFCLLLRGRWTGGRLS